MNKKKIFITEDDLKKLRRLLSLPKQCMEYQRNQKHLEDLEIELQRANILASDQIPSDVVTMNSKVRFVDLETGSSETYTLVFPEDANIDSGMISILAPIGTSLIGCKVGSEIKWPVPAGIRKLKVEEITYQPEAAGECHL